jgi:sn-glycerol 3-phosphate transport system permease protein
MIERRPVATILGHAILIAGVLVIIFPLYVAFVASTHGVETMLAGGIPLWPGDRLLENYGTILGEGMAAAGGVPVDRMLLNSLVMALVIAAGKIAISLLSAYAVVFFRFPLRNAAFWLIFVTLMLPVEVRIVPTFEVVADLGLLNSYAGLTVPLLASATATFLFRQFFLTIPDEYAEAARLDGAGPLRFFVDFVLPLSRTNIAALFVILFIYGWNQYLWPLLITTEERFYTVVMGIQRLSGGVSDSVPQWHLMMAATMLALLPPVLVVIAMQRSFVRGLVETEK